MYRSKVDAGDLWVVQDGKGAAADTCLALILVATRTCLVNDVIAGTQRSWRRGESVSLHIWQSLTSSQKGSHLLSRRHETTVRSVWVINIVICLFWCSLFDVIQANAAHTGRSHRIMHIHDVYCEMGVGM